MLDMLRHYTLEQLQKTDIDLLLPLYRWYCRQFDDAHSSSPQGSRIVERGGKLYEVKTPDQAAWTKNIF